MLFRARGILDMRRVFLAGQITSLLGDGLAILAIPLLVLHLTHDPVVAGLAGAMRSVGYLAVGVPAGPLVDRLNPARVLIAADAVRAGAFVALGVLAWLRVPQVWLLLAIAFVSACASVFFDAALAVTVQDLFSRERVLMANSSIETATQLSRVIGPPVAGVLAMTAGIADALWIDAATFLVSLATVGVVAGSTHPPAAAKRRAAGVRAVGKEFLEGLRYLRAQRLIFVLTVLFAITNLCLGVDTLLVFFGQVTLGLSPTEVSAVIAAGGVAGVLGALIAPRLDAVLPRVPLIAVTIALAGAAVAAMAAAGSVWTLAACNAALIFATAQAGLLVRSIRQELVPRRMLGRITAAVRTVFVSATPLGSVVAGLGTRAAGGDPRPTFLAAGCALALATVIAWFTTLRHQAGYQAGHQAGHQATDDAPATTSATVTATDDQRPTSR
jgi:MFS family permease